MIGEILGYCFNPQDEFTQSTSPVPLAHDDVCSFTLAAPADVLVEFDAEGYADAAGAAIGMTLLVNELGYEGEVQVIGGANAPMRVGLRDKLTAVPTGTYLCEVWVSSPSGAKVNLLHRLLKVTRAS